MSSVPTMPGDAVSLTSSAAPGGPKAKAKAKAAPGPGGSSSSRSSPSGGPSSRSGDDLELIRPMPRLLYFACVVAAEICQASCVPLLSEFVWDGGRCVGV